MTTLYTFGYAPMHDAADLRALLGDKVTAVVDVRMSPFSRNRAFSHGSKATVEAAGYGYLHLKGLGNAAYKSGGIEIARPADAGLIANALKLQPSLSLALMCVCAHPDECHRTTVAQLVADLVPGLKIVHLRPLGTLPFPD